jgi:hypothetical protein
MEDEFKKSCGRLMMGYSSPGVFESHEWFLELMDGCNGVQAQMGPCWFWISLRS